MSSPIKRYRFSLLFLLGFMILPACWDDAGLNGESGGYPITAIAIDPTSPNIIYVATRGDGVYKSTDGGVNWDRSIIGLLHLSVEALAVDPFDPNTVYAGTEGGVYQSLVKGEIWTGPITGSGAGITAIVIDRISCNIPGQPCKIVYASSESVGVLKGIDFGSDWSPMTGLTETAVKSLAIYPPLYLPGQCTDIQDDGDCPPLAAVTTLYAGTEEGHVFRLDTLAGEWVEDKPTLSDDDTTQEVLSLAVDPITPTIVYAGLRIEGGGIFNLYRRVGQAWFVVDVPGTVRDSVRVIDFSLAPDENGVKLPTIYVGISGLSKSTDGVKWDPINNDLDKTVLSLAIDPLDPKIMYAGSFNSRLFKTVDGGQTWFPIDISF